MMSHNNMDKQPFSRKYILLAVIVVILIAILAACSLFGRVSGNTDPQTEQGETALESNTSESDVQTDSNTQQNSSSSDSQSGSQQNNSSSDSQSSSQQNNSSSDSQSSSQQNNSSSDSQSSSQQNSSSSDSQSSSQQNSSSSEDSSSENPPPSVEIIEQTSASYEEWLGAAILIGVSMEHQKFEFDGIYTESKTDIESKDSSNGVYILFESDGQKIAIHSKPLEKEREDKGTKDISANNIGFATFDEVEYDSVDTTIMTEIKTEGLEELINQSLLVSIYSR